MVIPLLKDFKITCLSERYVLAHQKIRTLRNSVGFITWKKQDGTTRMALAALKSSAIKGTNIQSDSVWQSHLLFPPASRCCIVWDNSFPLQLKGYSSLGLPLLKPGLHGCLKNGDCEDLNKCILLPPICTQGEKHSNFHFSRAFYHFTAPAPAPASAQGFSRLPPITLT